MTSEKYITELNALLSKLSEEDRKDSLDFYREYAEEAGITTYEGMTEVFGLPQTLASNIYADSAIKQVKAENNKKGSVGKGFLIGLSALFTLPFTLPILAVGSCILFAVCISMIAIVFSLGFSLLSLGGTAITLFLRSFVYLFRLDIILWLKCFGGALVMGAITVGSVLLIVFIAKTIMKFATIIISKFIKGSTVNE